MLNEFKKFIEVNKLVNPDDKILLAVSGGIDSMVMTQLFRQTGYKFGIAHCNFMLRSSESDKDEQMVARYASENNIPFYSVRFETKIYAKQRGLSIQMAARELRYEWFEKIRSGHGYDKISVAHNLNDNIETLLINLTRGTGITGLTGMKPLNNNIIRPMLFAKRQDISDYCGKNGIIFREDQSNADTKYIRNKIRHLIIPVLREINPSIESTLNETAERFTFINEMITEYISGIREKVSVQNEEIIRFNISLLRAHILNKAVLYELFKPYGITNAGLDDLINVIEGNTGGQIFTETFRIMNNRTDLIVSHLDSGEESIYFIDDPDGIAKVPGIVSAVIITISDRFEIPSEPLVACLDSEKVLFPVTIRKWRAGDHFYPLGMNQKKKLSDYFIDEKYSRLDKEKILILESDGKIAWIIGERIDDRFKVTATTKKTLIITLLK